MKVDMPVKVQIAYLFWGCQRGIGVCEGSCFLHCAEKLAGPVLVRSGCGGCGFLSRVQGKTSWHVICIVLIFQM